MYKEHNSMAAMTLINFKLHPSFIHSAIKDQASGIDKAIAELVMNSLDAGATRVDIHVNEIDEKYHFTIKDNGKGFSEQSLDEQSRAGKGLNIVKQRVDITGGELSLYNDTSEQGGAVCEITLPIHACV